MVDISIIINCHNEGRQLRQTVDSVIANIELCKQSFISAELIFVRDNADDATIFFTDEFAKENSQVLTASFGDLGLARNLGATAASGKYLAFVDGDDLWSQNWLLAAIKFAEAQNKKCVLHTESAILFDAEHRIWEMQDSESADFDESILFEYNPWYPSSFASREIYLSFPYCAVDLAGGFFYEDWHWNCETLAAGIPHKVVPDTFHCYRSKSVWKEPSPLAAASRTKCTMPPSNFFSLAYQKSQA